MTSMLGGLASVLGGLTGRRSRRKSRKLVPAVSAEKMEQLLLLQGRIAARTSPVGKAIRNLSEVEFRVFSQWGEDGIIEWLVAHVDVPNQRFVEFGVESFREANCRFLLKNRGWKGLVLDGGEHNIAAIKSEPDYWRHDLTAKSAFITVDNIDALIREAGFGGPLGILSIDIDGNDYWIWKVITSVQPAIVICEYNAVLGDTRPIVVPYDSSFQRPKAHFSGQSRRLDCTRSNTLPVPRDTHSSEPTRTGSTHSSSRASLLRRCSRCSARPRRSPPDTGIAATSRGN